MSDKRFNRVGGYVYDGEKCISHFEDVKHRDDIVTLLNELAEENEELKKNERQLSIDFMGYKMRLIEVLQKRYDKTKGQTLYADVFLEIAEEMGVDLE